MLIHVITCDLYYISKKNHIIKQSNITTDIYVLQFITHPTKENTKTRNQTVISHP